MNSDTTTDSLHSARQTAVATRWFVPVRILSYVLILLLGLHVAFHSPVQLGLFIGYSLATLALAGTFLGIGGAPGFARAIRLIQFLLELGVLGGITAQVPVLDPRLPVIFLLTIVSAALCYRLVGTLVLASAAAVMLVGGTLASKFDSDILPLLGDPLHAFSEISDTIYFGILLQLLTIYLVAFVAGYLAEKLTTLRREHDEVSRALSRIRLETDEILLHLNSGIISVTADGTIAQLNRAAERLLDIHGEGVCGRLLSHVLPARLDPFAMLIRASMEKDEERHRFEVNVVNNKGNLLPLGVSTSLLRHSDQTVRGVIVIFSDLTEAKALEARIRAADRMAAIGELSASIAHEIRNPLAAISGSVEVLASDLKPVGDSRRLMELIVDESQRLTRILNEFLSYARIDQPRWADVPLARVIDQVLALLARHPSYEPGIQLIGRCAPDGPLVRSDEQLLRQLLLNLGINAIEAMAGTGGTFQIVARKLPNGGVTIKINDSAGGIDPEVLSRMFEPFFSTKEGGTGLGLAIVHRLATSLEISIEVSSSPETGTNFVLHLPSAPVPMSGNDVGKEKQATPISI